MRPNIVLLSVDELHYQALSCMGNPHVRTPHMDALFQEGVFFDHAYSSNPVCSPARSSWATGLYTSENGVSTNFAHLHETIPDIGQLLAAGGYYPAHAGKWHVEGRNPRDSFHCLYYGNDEMWAYGAEIFDCATTHGAISFLETYEERTPFYLQLGYVNPHDMCEYLHNYEYKGIPPLEKYGLEFHLPPLPPNYKVMPNETRVMKAVRRDPNCLIHKPINRVVTQWTDHEWRMFLWNYYRYVEKVDVEIGKVINALQGSRFGENTVILFTVDHGESMGCHGTFQKFTLYEESVRVPLVVADLSGRFVAPKGSVNSSFVDGVDLFGTICDYAGIPNPTKSHSVRPLVEGRDEGLRPFSYIENNYWSRAVVTRPYKLVMDYAPNQGGDYTPPRWSTHRVGDCQLFDLESDPYETKDISPEHPAVVQELLGLLRDKETELQTPQVTFQGSRAIIDRFQAYLLALYDGESG